MPLASFFAVVESLEAIYGDGLALRPDVGLLGWLVVAAPVSGEGDR
jgi:hypothetical protein